MKVSSSVLVSASPRILRKNFKAEGRARSHQRKLRDNSRIFIKSDDLFELRFQLQKFKEIIPFHEEHNLLDRRRYVHCDLVAQT